MAITKTVNLDVQSNLDEASKSVGTLKSQLREAQAEVTALSDKFGATSQQAVEAAKRASELKDRIGDAKALTDAFNPDAKFRAVSASLSGVAGGFSAVTGAMGLLGAESESVEKQILKVQSAMAIASGVQELGESADAFKQMKAVAIDAFKGIKSAIGSTGIGLFVVALGTIYAYWDDIKEAVSGVSEQQLRLNDISQRNVDQAEEKLKTISAQDNILKLQGKSEQEILAIKVKQTDEAIAATKINIENQKTTNKLAEIGAKRNYEMLKSYIDFISAPVRFLYETATSAINKIINTINKIPGIDIKANIDEKFGDKAAEYIAKLGFDPAKVKSDGEATVKASQDTLNKLLNDRAGYILASQAIDKQGTDKPAIQDDKTKKNEEVKLERVEALASLVSHEDEKFKLIENGLAKKAEALKNDLAGEKEISQASIDLAKAEAKAKMDALDSYGSALGSIAGMLGESTDAGKAAAVASATISTYTSANKAYESQLAIPTPDAPVRATIAAGIAVVSGLLNVQKILSVKTPGGGGGGSAPAAGGAPAAPSFNVVGTGGANQIAQVMNDQGIPPVQAYVVASNVTSAQSLNRNIVNNATLG
jgi:hypothetical protein